MTQPIPNAIRHTPRHLRHKSANWFDCERVDYDCHEVRQFVAIFPHFLRYLPNQIVLFVPPNNTTRYLNSQRFHLQSPRQLVPNATNFPFQAAKHTAWRFELVDVNKQNPMQ